MTRADAGGVSRGVKAPLACLVVMLAVLAVTVEPASACSCIPPDPWKILKQADGAFVGRLESRREVDQGRAVLTFSVERAVKGSIGDTVEVTTANNGAACGIETPVGQRVGLFLDRSGNRWVGHLCWQVSPEDLLAAATLPAPNGRGPAAMFVGGRFGPARTLALDTKGRTLAYGMGSGNVLQHSACPAAPGSPSWCSAVPATWSRSESCRPSGSSESSGSRVGSTAWLPFVASTREAKSSRCSRQAPTPAGSCRRSLLGASRRCGGERRSTRRSGSSIAFVQALRRCRHEDRRGRRANGHLEVARHRASGWPEGAHAECGRHPPCRRLVQGGDRRSTPRGDRSRAPSDLCPHDPASDGPARLHPLDLTRPVRVHRWRCDPHLHLGTPSYGTGLGLDRRILRARRRDGLRTRIRIARSSPRAFRPGQSVSFGACRAVRTRSTPRRADLPARPALTEPRRTAATRPGCP